VVRMGWLRPVGSVARYCMRKRLVRQLNGQDNYCEYPAPESHYLTRLFGRGPLSNLLNSGFQLQIGQERGEGRLNERKRV